MDETLAIPDEDDLAVLDHAPEQAIQVQSQYHADATLTELAAGYIAIPLCPLPSPALAEVLAPACPQAGMLSVLEKGLEVAEEPLYLGAHHASVASAPPIPPQVARVSENCN